ncbi:MAG: hypothetical protein NC548_10905 [Lachnospiraceae bacterium]|nr:hypothetical protein [Lachnospiraceae bacterium]MCM1235273.1 hypothetical protein [Ruminococcus flavefaciens]
MKDKTIVIISGQVDATIKEQQPDVEFKIFRTLEDFGNTLDRNPIRAQTLFFTKDVVGGVNSTLSYLRKLVTENDYLVVDHIVYITETDSEELESVRYLIEEFGLDNWDIITGSMSRVFIAEVINGTFRGEKMSLKRKAVFRRPRQDYVKQKLREQTTLDEEYEDDDNDLSDIPDEEVPVLEAPKHSEHLQYMYIAGLPGYERTVFAFLAAQYIALTNKVIIIESDPDYHTLTEFSTKSKVDALHISMTMLYEDPGNIIQAIKETNKNLVIVECIDRIHFDYKYICALLYYNLIDDFAYMISEISLGEITSNMQVTVTVPSTVIDTLHTGELVDKSLVPNCRFVGVNLKHLPTIHVNSGVVMSTLLSDILSTTDIICPVVTVTSLLLNSTAYDLGGILGGL